MTQQEKDGLLNELLLEFQKDDRGAMSLLTEPDSRQSAGAARTARYERFREIGAALRAAGGADLMNDMIRNVRRANGSWAERLESAWKPLGYVPVSRLP